MLSPYPYSLLLPGGLVKSADEYLRIGMEAAYAPSTGPKTIDEILPSKSTVPTNMPTATMFKIAKKMYRGLRQGTLVVKTKWEGLVQLLTSGKLIRSRL